MRLPKLRGGGETPVAAAAPGPRMRALLEAAADQAADVAAALRYVQDHYDITPNAPAAPHAAAPVGAAGTKTPAVPVLPWHSRRQTVDRWTGAAGPEQPGARENSRSVPEEGSAGTRESARPVPATAGSCGNTGQPPERAGVPGDAPAPPIDPVDTSEPRWFCVTCSDGHIGPCTAGTPRRRPMLLRLLDLIGRPA